MQDTDIVVEAPIEAEPGTPRRSLSPAASPRASLAPSVVAAANFLGAAVPTLHGPPVEVRGALVRASFAPSMPPSAPRPVAARPSLSPARPSLSPARASLSPARALASYAPPPRARVSWSPRRPEAAARRADAVWRLSEDLVTARLVAAVPRTHARAALSALTPLDRGIIDTASAILGVHADVGVPHLIEVACGLAELAAHCGRLRTACDIYQTLHRVTGDAEYEVRAAELLALAAE